MSCGHDGCTCGPDQPTEASQLPMADHAAGDTRHACGGHGHGGHGDGGCCGAHGDHH